MIPSSTGLTGGLRQSGLTGRNPRTHGIVGIVKLAALHNGPAEQARASGIGHTDLAHHLTHNDLNVLVVNLHGLQTVGALHLGNQVVLHGQSAVDIQDVVRVHGTVRQTVAGHHMVALHHADMGAERDHISPFVQLLRLVVSHHNQLLLLVLGKADIALDLGDDGSSLRLACLEQLLDTRQTLCDILAGRDTAGVEGAHGQLGTRLTDGLRRDGTHGLTDRDRLHRRQVDAVAMGTHAVARFAGQHRAHVNVRYAVLLDQLFGILLGHHMVAG